MTQSIGVPALIDYFWHEVETLFHGGCNGLKLIPFVDLFYFVVPKSQLDVLRVGHWLNPFSIDLVHLFHQGQDVGQIDAVAFSLMRLDTDTGEPRDTFYV